MVVRHRRDDGQVWILVDVRAPRWAVWCVAVGSVLIGASLVAGLVMAAVQLW